MKRLVKLTVILLFLIISSSVRAQTVDDLVFITENYPPLNFEKDRKLQGVSVDVLLEILKRVGSKQTIKDIELLPWARGYKMALNRKNTVLFVMGRTEARENLFKWVGPLLPSKIVLIAEKKRGIKINSVKDINQYTTGAVREDIGEQMLLNLGVKKEQIYLTNSGITTAKMLHKGRFDMWAYEQIVALWNIKELGYNPKDYEEVYILKESAYYYAFHRGTNDKIVVKLQKALDELLADGKVKELLNKYLH